MPICFMPGRLPGPDKDEMRDGALGVSRTAPTKEALGVSRTAPTKEALGVAAGTHSEWREPPGYLGEAVRRAKRIASLDRNTEPPMVQD
jgi:hypothetical protein